MLPRPFGKSGTTLPPLGLGCWAIGGPFQQQGGWLGYGDVDDAESLRALHYALAQGITLFDTADAYGCGHSERLLGQATHQRQEVFIATKFGYTFDEARREVTGRLAGPAAIRAACEASLRRLGREVIDLYQLHVFDYPVEHGAEMREVLEDLVRAGKIRFYAWCTEDPERLRLFAQGPHCVAAPQLQNVLELNRALLQLTDSLGLAPLIRRPLGMGLLTGKFHPESQLAANDMRQRFGWNFKAGKQANQLTQLEAVRAILTSEGRTLAQGALAWLWALHPAVIPFPGFKTVAQVTENMGALGFGPLTPAQVQAIDEVLQRPGVS